jgi:hypothetical protein
MSVLSPWLASSGPGVQPRRKTPACAADSRQTTFSYLTAGKTTLAKNLGLRRHPSEGWDQFFCNLSAKLDYAPLLRRALRASFAVRFGIPASAFQPTLE